MSHQRHLRGRSLRSTNWIEDTRGELALQQLGVPVRAARSLYAAGYRTREDIASSPDAELLLVPGVGPARLAATRAAVPYASPPERVQTPGSALEEDAEAVLLGPVPDWWGGIKEPR